MRKYFFQDKNTINSPRFQHAKRSRATSERRVRKQQHPPTTRSVQNPNPPSILADCHKAHHKDLSLTPVGTWNGLRHRHPWVRARCRSSSHLFSSRVMALAHFRKRNYSSHAAGPSGKQATTTHALNRAKHKEQGRPRCYTPNRLLFAVPRLNFYRSRMYKHAGVSSPPALPQT